MTNKETMTNKEAIAIIRKEYLCVDRECEIEKSCGKCDLMMPSKEPILEAYKVAIRALEQEPCEDMVSRGVLEQVRWERDVAIGQLKELGYEFGEKIEPCEDTISRQAVKELYYKDGYISFRKICELPPITPQPKMGKWIKSRDSYGNNHFTCPFCEHDIATKADSLGDNYCSNCGAKLQEVEE